MSVETKEFKLGANDNVADVMDFDNSIVSDRLWLPEGVHPASVKLSDSGDIVGTELKFTDAKRLDKKMYLLPVIVKVEFGKEGEEGHEIVEIEGNVGVTSPIAIKDLQRKVANGKRNIYVNVKHAMKDGNAECYCSLASDIQAKVQLLAEMKAASEKKEEEARKERTENNSQNEGVVEDEMSATQG